MRNILKKWLTITFIIEVAILQGVFAATGAQLHFLTPFLTVGAIAAPFVAAILTAQGVDEEHVRVATLLIGKD